ncbi:MAG TPA: ABC transporter permease [Vicinamibacterales bacterium]|jgi:putative ABC transport system permease protein|nr:ABC transporter permease [Vicinamibacterales bacterium]
MNKLLESASIALDAIWSAKLRSLMTVLGNIVAVTSIIAVVSLIQGLNSSVKQAILNQAGADSFNIQQYPVTRSDEEFEKVRGNPRVTLDDARAIRRYGSENIAAVMADSTGNGRITYRDKSIDNTRIQGVTGDYVNFSSFDAERGRLMSATEVDSARPVAVVGWQTADRLFGADVDPIDKIIQIEGVHFRVLGVSAKRGSLLGQSQDEFAIIPLGQFRMMFGSRRTLSLSVKPRDLAQIAPAIDDATIALRSARRLKPRQGENFGIFTADTILDIYHSATNGIFAVLVGVVGLSLVVGGIVIMNIMLMAVTERTREIGLRKALGARRSDIMAQMLTESVVLSVFGGVIGTAFGIAIALTIASFTPIPAAVEAWSVALGIAITALVGLFFGLYPAMRAARLDPIEALRRE